MTLRVPLVLIVATACLNSAQAAPAAYRITGTKRARVGDLVTLRISPKPPPGTTFSWGAILAGQPDFLARSPKRSRTWRRRFDHTGTYRIVVQMSLRNRGTLDAYRSVTSRIRLTKRPDDPTEYCNRRLGSDSIGMFAAFIATDAGCTTAYDVLTGWLDAGAPSDNAPAPWSRPLSNRSTSRMRMTDDTGRFIRFAFFVNGD